MSTNKFSYVELPTNSTAALKTFYGSLFGWTFQDWGDDYATVHGSDLEAGFNADPDSKSATPLVMIETDNITAAHDQVIQSGGTITKPIFAYPGGKRFHFTDPAGNELAIMQPRA